MKISLQEAIIERRSYYHLTNQSPLSNSEIKALTDLAIKHVPSPFNSQSARTILLAGPHHHKFWEIVKGVSETKMSTDSYKATKSKIESSFQSGYGTILFYEDMGIIRNLQEQYPRYREKFPVWSDESSGMLQYAVWLLLKEAGLGASLQHYDPLIDEEVAKNWNFPADWKLKAEMPFGKPLAEPGVKEFNPLEGRSFLFE